MPKHLHNAERGAARRAEPPTTPLGTTRMPVAPAALPSLGVEPALAAARREGRVHGHALTRRALVLGLTLVVFVAALTPYNDYVLRNSPLIGNHFPVGIVTLMTALVLLVNPALQFFGRRALGTGELVTVMSMLLVAAAAPSSGLMRYFEPMLIAPFRIVETGPYPWLKPIAQLMPTWLVPTTDGTSPIAQMFFERPDPIRGERIPVLAFILPMALWTIFIAAIMGGAFYLSAIFRKQWVHHERLAYPLATIPLELFAAPEPGRYYNNLWRSGVLWAGAAIPLMIGLLNGLHTVWPAVPEIKLSFDFSESFFDHPWNNMPWYLSSAKLYLAVIGICFFIPSEVALSLWLFLMINGLLRVATAGSGVDLDQSEPVRGMGIYFAYFAGLLWLARGHLKTVFSGAWRNTPREEGEFGSYRSMVRNLLICGGVAWLWLMLVGMQWWVAALMLLVGVVMVTLMSRVVAETGLFWVNANWWGASFFGSLMTPKLVSTASYYWAQVTSRLFFADLRETLMPYTTNVMRMAGRESDVQAAEKPRLLKWLFLALAVSVLVSGVAHHYLSYSYGRSVAFTDNWASETVPHGALSETFAFAKTAPAVPVERAWTHFGFGAVMVAVLMVGRVMFVAWPFHPIGLLLMNAGPMQSFWFSILIGWAIKQALLRYGGAGVFKRAKPFFIGLIVGEIVIAGAWLFLGLATNGAVNYRLLPG